jgi:hypothetical protein
MTRCSEYKGKASATGYREQCSRPATNEAWFLGKWTPLCQYHRAQYSDLPMRKAGSFDRVPS